MESRRRVSGRIVFLLGVVALSGCVDNRATPVPPAPTQPPSLLARCGADGLLDLIGQPISVFVAPSAAKTVRVLRPNDPMTEDYSETRLNVILDDKDRVSALSCG